MPYGLLALSSVSSSIACSVITYSSLEPTKRMRGFFSAFRAASRMLSAPTTFTSIVVCGMPHEAPTLLMAARLMTTSGPTALTSDSTSSAFRRSAGWNATSGGSCPRVALSLPTTA